ncbi:MAG: LysR family transcriptional regulator [Dialister micraerophilus]|nr:LysR family transcriptional regulator [Dialister micraerophilus]
MKLTLLGLRYFQKIAELQHITRAAEILHISQPSLSHIVKVMETELGVPLFERRGRNIVLTHYGEILLLHTNHIMEELDAAKKEIARIKEKQKMTVKISISSNSITFPAFLTTFHRHHPEIHFEIHQKTNQLSKTSAKSADLFFTTSFTPPKGKNIVTLLKENIILALAETDENTKKTSCKLEDYKNSGFISLEPSKTGETITEHFCQKAGFVPQTILESDSITAVTEFIRAGLGISLVPEITWHGLRGTQIKLLQIESPKCERYLNLSWTEGKELSEPAKIVKEFIIQNFMEFAKNYTYKKG